MKRFFVFAALSAIALSACQQELDIEGNKQGETVVFTATTEVSSTRTALSENGDNYDVVWSSGDQITLLGISYDGTSYYYSDSPDIASIIIYEGTVNPPSSAPRRAPQRMTAPAVAMAASVSYWDSENNAWGQETPLTTSKIFEPNDTIDLYIVWVERQSRILG